MAPPVNTGTPPTILAGLTAVAMLLDGVPGPVGILASITQGISAAGGADAMRTAPAVAGLEVPWPLGLMATVVAVRLVVLGAVNGNRTAHFRQLKTAHFRGGRLGRIRTSREPTRRSRRSATWIWRPRAMTKGPSFLCLDLRSRRGGDLDVGVAKRLAVRLQIDLPSVFSGGTVTSSPVVGAGLLLAVGK